MRGSGAVVVSGSTGFVGGLIVASLLRLTDRRLVLLVRPGRDTAALTRRLVGLIGGDEPLDLNRLHFAEFPGEGNVADVAAGLRPLGVREILHAAGCVDYFATDELERSNVALTQRMIELARQLSVDRLSFVSTAYSSGYIDGLVGEWLHGEPTGGDPTEYTRTKRKAESLIAASGVPWLILRPSIVIGDSHTGVYSGKRYGLYQFWMGIERLLCDRWHNVMHISAPQRPLNFVHQDCLQSAVTTILDQDWTRRVINIVSSSTSAPEVRELWELWFSAVGRPDSVVYYDKVESVPLERLHPRQKAFAMFARVNMQIAAHQWDFERTTLDRLVGEDLLFHDATLASVERCQAWFLQNSAIMTNYIKQYRMSGVSASSEIGFVDRGTSSGTVPA